MKEEILKIAEQLKLDHITTKQSETLLLDLFGVNQRSEMVCLERRNGWHCTYFFPSSLCKICEYCKPKQTCG